MTKEIYGITMLISSGIWICIGILYLIFEGIVLSVNFIDDTEYRPLLFRSSLNLDDYYEVFGYWISFMVVVGIGSMAWIIAYPALLIYCILNVLRGFVRENKESSIDIEII